MGAKRAYKAPNAARSPPRAAKTSETSPMGAVTGGAFTARQSLILGLESTLLPEINEWNAEVIPMFKTP